MRRKIFWITMWVTMMLWLGQAWAQNNPARETTGEASQDAETARTTEIDPFKIDEASHPAPTDFTGQAATQAVSQNIADERAMRTTTNAIPTRMSTHSPVPPSDPRSLIDRSGWPELVITPADGRTMHGQAWLRTKAPTAGQLPTLGPAFTMVTLEQSLEGASPGGYNLANLRAGTFDVGQTAVYLVLLPLRAVTIEPFWESQTTP